MPTLIAEGKRIEDIKNIDQYIAKGQLFEVQFMLGQPLAKDEIADIKEQFSANVIRMKVFQTRDNVLHIRMRKPIDEGGVGFWWWPLLLVGGGLTGFFGWKILTWKPEEFLMKLTPIILLIGGLAILAIWVSKKT